MYSFDKIPETLDTINVRLARLERLLTEKNFNDDVWFSFDEAREYLGSGEKPMPAPTLYTLVRNRKIQFSKPGKHLKFKRSWCDSYLEGRHANG